MGELGGDRDDSEDREDKEAKDCGASWERLALLWFRGSGVNRQQSLDTASGGRR